MTDTTLRQLLALLDEERNLLLKGDIGAIGSLEAAKLDLAQRLEAEDQPSVEALDKLRRSVERNRRLLEAARKGLKSGADRLREIRKALLRLDTYTRGGNLTNLQQASPNVSRRA